VEGGWVGLKPTGKEREGKVRKKDGRHLYFLRHFSILFFPNLSLIPLSIVGGVEPTGQRKKQRQVHQQQPCNDFEISSRYTVAGGGAFGWHPA
jgi:hypothetical protein